MGAGMRYQPQGLLRLNAANPITLGLSVVQVGAQDNGFTNTNGVTTSVTTAGRAKKYASASSQYLTRPKARTADQPLTMFTLVKVTSTSVNMALMSMGGSAADRILLYLGNGQPSIFSGSGSFSQAVSAVISANVMYGIGARVSSSSSRDVWVNGIRAASDTGTQSVGATTQAVIGAYWNSGAPNAGFYLDGEMPLALQWDRALSDVEMKSIADNPWQVFQAADDEDFIVVASGISGTSATTDGADSSVANGAVSVAGSSPGVDGADTSSAAGGVLTSGSSTVADGADAGASSGAVAVSGSSTATDGADPTVASGGVSIVATAASIDGADGSAASGSVAISGSSTTTDSADTESASGSVVTGVSGSSGTTDGADSSAASGGVTIAGSSAKTDAADTVSASGAVSVAGSAASADGPDVSAASGSVVSGVLGSSATVDGADGRSAIGAVAIAGGAAANDGADISSASGLVQVAASTPHVPSSRTVNFDGGSNRVNFDGGTNRVNF